MIIEDFTERLQTSRVRITLPKIYHTFRLFDTKGSCGSYWCTIRYLTRVVGSVKLTERAKKENLPRSPFAIAKNVIIRKTGNKMAILTTVVIASQGIDKYTSSTLPLCGIRESSLTWYDTVLYMIIPKLEQFINSPWWCTFDLQERFVGEILHNSFHRSRRRSRTKQCMSVTVSR